MWPWRCVGWNNIFYSFLLGFNCIFQLYSSGFSILYCGHRYHVTLCIGQLHPITAYHDLYQPKGYNVIENHRDSRIGGGVALCIQDHLSVTKRPDISVYCSYIESVFVEIDKDQLGSDKNIVIGTIYRPPGHDLDTFILEIEKILDVLHKENKTIYIMGDYNINLLNSDTHNPTGSFLDTMYSNMLYPLITRPTRVTANSATLIDNIFTNNTCNTGSTIQGVFVTDITDHYPVFHMNQELITESADEYFVKRLYNSKNKNDFIEAISLTDWSEMYGASDTQGGHLINFITLWWNCTINTSQK